MDATPLLYSAINDSMDLRGAGNKAAQVLSDNPDAAKMLGSAIRSTNDHEIITTASYALMALDSPAADQELMAILAEDGYSQAPEAARMLGDKHDDVSIAALRDAVANSEWKVVRATAVRSLASAAGPGALPSLKEVFTRENDEQDNDWFVRARAVEAIGEIRTPEAVEFLMGLMPSVSNHYALRCVVESLGELRDPQALDLLIGCLQDEVTREPAITALGKIGDPRAIDLLRPFLADDNARLQYLAKAALKEIGEEDPQPPMQGNAQVGVQAQNQSPATIRCPQCGFQGRIPVSYLGQAVRCRKCQTRFVAALADHAVAGTCAEDLHDWPLNVDERDDWHGAMSGGRDWPCCRRCGAPLRDFIDMMDIPADQRIRSETLHATMRDRHNVVLGLMRRQLAEHPYSEPVDKWLCLDNLESVFNIPGGGRPILWPLFRIVGWTAWWLGGTEHMRHIHRIASEQGWEVEDLWHEIGLGDDIWYM